MSVDLCYDHAIKLLARREHSAFELAQKLASRQYHKPQIDQAIADLKTKGYLSDQRFCAMLIRSRAGFGRKRICFELEQHHIDPSIIQEQLATSDIDWPARARSVYAKKYGNCPVADFKDQQKRKSYLYQRGFGIEEINLALRECLGAE